MSGCESPPANLRQTKVSQILHGLASDPLTGLLFVAAPCRCPPPFLLLFRIPLRDPARLQLLQLRFAFLSRKVWLRFSIVGAAQS